MRKHFLLLFLMAILPLAGWSANFTTEGKAVVDDIPYGSNVTTANIHFTLNNIPQESGVDAIYKWEGKYYTNATATTELTGTPQCNTTYWIKVIPSDNTNNGETIAEVLFVKAELTVTIKSEAFFTKNFMATKTALGNMTAKKSGAEGEADIVVDGIVGDETIASVLTWTGADYSYASENANCTPNGQWFVDANNDNIITNKITFSNIALTTAGAQNYNLTINDAYMKIKQIALTAANYATAAATGKFTVTRGSSYKPANKPAYTGAAQNLNYTVAYKYGNAAGNVYNLQESDFVIKYKNADNSYDNAINALAYSPVISFKAHGNFSGEDIDLSAAGGYSDANLGYEIVKKSLYVLLNTNTKKYDGTRFLSSADAQPTPTFNYSSLVGQDAGKTVVGLTWQSLEANENVDLKKDVNTYSITFVENAFADVKIEMVPAGEHTAATAAAYNAGLDDALEAGVELTGEQADAYNAALNPVTAKAAGDMLTPDEATAYNETLGEAVHAGDEIPAVQVALTANYEPVGVAADWTITAKALAVTAAPTYPEEATSITFGDNIPAITVSQEGALDGEADDVLDCYKATTAGKNDVLVGDNVITVSLKDADDYAAEWIVDNAVDAENPTAEELVQAAAAGEDAVEDATALLANYTPTVTNGVLKVVGVGLTIIPNISATYLYGATPAPTYAAFNSKTHAPVALTKAPVYLYRASTEATYDETATTAPKAVGTYFVTVKDDGELAPVNGYDPKKITYEETPFEIAPKPLNLTVADQIVIKKDSKTVFLTKLANADDSWELDDEETTEYGETLTLEFSLNEYNATTNPAGTVVVTGGKIMSKADGVELDANGYIANAIKVELTGETAGNYDITGYTLGKLKISDAYVADLAEATAIQTITEAAANQSKYNVTISDRKLNADKWNVMVLPFAVKPLDFCKTVDQYAVFNVLKSAENGNVKFGLWYETIPANQPFLVKTKTAVDFDLKWDHDNNNATPKVKKYVFEDVTFVNAEPKQTSVTGAEFIGTYEDITIQDDSYYAMQGGVFKHFSTELPLLFTRAYIVLTDATQDARFFVEEPGENGTTAIKELNIDTMDSVSVDGWYTLNGVKLQSIPTEKGVYINNGKKVVIK